MHFSCAYVRSCVCVCMWVWVCVRVRVYVCVCMWWLPPISLLLLSPTHPLFPFLPHPLPPPPSPPPYVRLCMCVLFFHSLFPTSLKAALHHTPPLHFQSCFDLCYEGISCVRLMGFFSGYSGFPIHPLGCLELDFCSSFSKVRFYLRCIVYFSCISFLPFVPLFPPPPLFFLFFFWRILIIVSYSLRHALLLFPSRQSCALFLPPASWHPMDKDKLV